MKTKWQFIPSCVPGGVFSIEFIDVRPGTIIFEVHGKNAESLFANESGGHQWQRIPPTEKNGRVQTSTITVAVFKEYPASALVLNERDLEWKTCRSSGKGGQNANKVETAVTLKHIPSSITIRCENERSQKRNKDIALTLLRSKLIQRMEDATATHEANLRHAQIGFGMRGGKRRTLKPKQGTVVDHLTNKTWNYSQYVKGIW